MSLHAVEAEQAMGARIIPFLEKVTETFSYLVMDPPTQAAAIIDPVLDYDPAAGRIRTHSADAIAKMVQAEGVRVEWILETHVHADHLSAAGYLKKKLGGALGIGSNVRQVQQILGNLFNDKPAIPPGAGFDHLFEDGETFRIGALDVKALYTPGHTPATCWKTPCSPATPSSCQTMERRDAIRWRCADALSFHPAASGIAAANPA